jgi:hypothetical protein
MMFINAEGKTEAEEGYPPFMPLKAAAITAFALAAAVLKARKKGLQTLRKDIVKRLQTAIGKARNKIWRDGMQTPWEGGNVIYYAQHGTATCCRKCVEEWHKIDRSRPLTEKEIQYLSELVMGYIRERLPSLTEEGEKVVAKKQLLHGKSDV